jgi:hypothetical protein
LNSWWNVWCKKGWVQNLLLSKSSLLPVD